MTFVLKREVAAVLGPQRSQTINDAMAVLTGSHLEGDAFGAKLDLQRELFDLMPSPRDEEKEP